MAQDKTMKTTIAAIALSLLLASSTPSHAQVQSGRIVTVDLDRTFKEYYKTPIASAKLKDQAEQFNKEHDEMLAQYRKQVDELNKLREEQDKTEYTEEVRTQKKKAFQDKLVDTQKSQREIEEFRNSHRQILDQQQQRMRTGIIKEISEVITKEARDAGYAFVFDKSGNTLNGIPGLVYSQDSVEITDDIIKILNKNRPADAPKVEEKKTDKPADKK
jgi:Skp family chaperone for outer membrane proteins